MPRTLYMRLTLVLGLLLCGVAVAYTLLSVSLTRHYTQELSQRFNRNLAANLVADRGIIAEGPHR